MPRYADPAASRWFSWCSACLVGDHGHCQPVPWCECWACPAFDVPRTLSTPPARRRPAEELP